MAERLRRSRVQRYDGGRDQMGYRLATRAMTQPETLDAAAIWLGSLERWEEAATLYDRAQDLCSARLSPPDRVRLVDAVLAATASGARWLHSDMGRPFPARVSPPVGESCSDVTVPQGVRELFCGLETAARGALSLETSTRSVAAGRAELPALVLSGGSANGAFTAGYVYELLRLREASLGWYADEPEAVAGIHRTAAFSAIVSTSVVCTQRSASASLA